MTAIVDTIEVAREQEDVFAYAADPLHLADWQEAVERIELETPTRVRETRRVTGGSRTFRFDIVERDEPRRWSFRGIDGPVRPHGTFSFARGQNGATSVRMEIDFDGHGPGKLLTPFARRDARRQVPRDLAALKERLERPAS